MVERHDTSELFKKLKIREYEYPSYTDAEQFGRNIKKCSLLKSHEIRYSNSTASEEIQRK
jgi:hypothetical protein